MKLKGQTALITGGNSGIGLATARLFVAAGARVAITGRNNTTLDAAAKELGQNALTFRADVLDSKAREVWSDQNSKWERGSPPPEAVADKENAISHHAGPVWRSGRGSQGCAVPRL